MKQLMRAVGLAVGIAIGTVSSVRATSIEAFNQWKYDDETVTLSKSEVLRIVLSNVYHAFDWANAVNEGEGLRPLFCPPEDLSVEDELVIRMIEDELQNPSAYGLSFYPSDTPIELILLHGAKNMFPCR